MTTCPDCGCKMYNGHCVNCHEETYIYEQNQQAETIEEMIAFSDEFIDKVKEQAEETKEILEQDKNG